MAKELLVSALLDARRQDEAVVVCEDWQVAQPGALVPLIRLIEVHRARIMEKLGAKNACDLVRIVLRQGPRH